jgi:2-hydroxy-3-oxopropionate reductase
MSRIGFIGLGIMGGPMAANLVAAGHEVVGFNRSPGKIQALVERGGRGATSIAEAVAGAEVIITMLPDSPDVETVVLGEGGVLSAASRGALLIDMSTIEPQMSRRVAEVGGRAGLRVLDAPVSGGEQGAIDGTLSVMVGGAAEDLDAARPYLDVVGAAVVHVGPAGAGQTVKAANQLIVAGHLSLIAEAIVFLEASGLDTAAALEVIGAGLAGSTALARKGSGMLAREFKPGFRLDLHHKDLGIALGAARANSVTLPVSALVGQLVAALCAQGRGGEDHSALLRIIDQLSGR